MQKTKWEFDILKGQRQGIFHVPCSDGTYPWLQLRSDQGDYEQGVDSWRTLFWIDVQSKLEQPWHHRVLNGWFWERATVVILGHLIDVPATSPILSANCKTVEYKALDNQDIPKLIPCSAVWITYRKKWSKHKFMKRALCFQTTVWSQNKGK